MHSRYKVRIGETLALCVEYRLRKILPNNPLLMNRPLEVNLIHNLDEISSVIV